MKPNCKNIIGVLGITLAVSAMVACKKSFFDGTPKGQYTTATYFKTPAEVQAATASMYGAAWFNFNCTYSMSIGDVYSGNSTGDANAAMVQFQNMNVTQSNEYLYKGWASLYSVVGQANGIMMNLANNPNAVSLDAATVNTAMGECYFMRAAAYFYLVRNYGAVPIVTDTNNFMGNYQLPRHIVSDVYKFIINDLKQAETKLPAKGAAPGRVSAGAAKALLAKVYLTIDDFANAKARAWELISNESTYGYGLRDKFEDLFYTRNNNNKESIWALQWTASGADGAYGTGNVTQAYCAPYGQELTGSTDGWGSFKPSIDLQRDSIAGDLRRKPTYMRANDYYPELLQIRGGYTYPSCKSKTGANVKKYVVGNYEDNAATGGAYGMSTGINTYMIRYADVLLTYVEAVMGNSTSTNDPIAIAQFLRVRTRAGLGGIPVNNITADDLLRERRLEFAFEGQYWYDILRLPQDKALQRLSKTERGMFEGWCGDGAVVSNKISVTANMLLFPVPQSEIDIDPKLSEVPVPYY
ncbi:MAG: RagB/SusD family nutrient uptake outer membrane protein [Niastella sp.]|uniref:RagB/SusD family nutrient uptake outer membrane protein n=1 Tax=Niastella sp. TaxID=1869183 RepID=UPI00389989EC